MPAAWPSLREKPLQRRVTLLTVALVTLAVLVSNVGGYLALRSTLVHASQALAAQIAGDLVDPASRALALDDTLPADLRQAGGVVVEAVDARGTVTRVPGEQAELVLEPDDLAATGPSGTGVRRTGTDTRGQRYVVVAVPMPATGDALVVGRPLGPVLEILRTARVIALLVVLVSLLGAGVAGGFVARAGLRPVRDLTAAVTRVAETRDFQPVAVRHVSGELAVLAASFNQLLRAIARMRERQSRLVADAGQQLRLPLAGLTANIDLLVADQATRSLGVEREAVVLADVRAQLVLLTRLVSDLVALTRDDGSAGFRPLDLRDVVRTAVERVKRRSPAHRFDVALEEFHVIGDAAVLERVVTNLLDNAVTWGPPGSTVRVRLEGNRLRVADSGPGIPEAELPLVFDRFFRGAAARRTPGSGLGLSIVAKAVEDHGGSVSAGRSDDGGTELVVRMPGVTHREAIPALLVPAA